MSIAKPALLELKEQYESIFEYSPYAIFVHNIEEITNVNQAFLDVYGYESKEEVLGKPPIQTIVYVEDIDLVRQARNRLTQHKPNYIPSIRVKRKNGEVFYVESHFSIVSLGGRLHHQVLTRDISENKRVEIELFESERKYRKLFEDSRDGIYKSTPAGKFVEVNQAMVEMLGYDSVEELLSIDIETQLYFKKEDRKIMADKKEDCYPLKCKDGSGIWVEDHSYYEYDDQGKIIFHHGILRDVTGKLEKEEETQRLLEVTEDQNKRLQNFAHIISHNIRSHSANLSSLVKFMEEKEANKEMLFDMLKVSTSKLEETILNLNEIITVNQNLNQPLEQRHLHKEVENTLKVLSGDIMNNKIDVEVSIPSNMKVNVIPAYLDSILLNVISNAIKYCTEEANAYVKISAEKKGGFNVLSISDNGIGIDLTRNEKKLFRMYETFNYNKDSRGFGLYITKNQVEAMQGKIEVESEPGKGSTFRIFFKNKTKK